LAKRTAVGLNEIRKLINVENKFIDVDSSTTASFSGAIQYISPIAQGDNISDREGNSIKVQTVHLTGSVFYSAASIVPVTMRILVIRDLQNFGTAPTVNDVLQTIGTIYAPYQKMDFINGNDENKRFSLVFDRTFNLSSFHPNHYFDIESNHDCHVYYRDATAATTGAGNGSYWFLAISNVNTNLPYVDYNFRIRYTDN